MCEFCNPTPPLSRRQMLALTGSAVALLFAGCKQEQPLARPPVAASQPTTAPLGAPDLGAEVFADASGRALVPPSAAPVIIVPRTDWTSQGPNLAQLALMNGVGHITVHHTAWKLDTDAWSLTATELEHIRGFHAGTAPTDRGWADIAYHFVVDRAGRVWQARPLAYQGAHVKSHNEHNLGIVLLGNFDQQSPSAAQLVALGNFIPFLRELYHVPLSEVFTHGELGLTACPGQKLQNFMNRFRRSCGATTLPARVTTLPATQPGTQAASRP